MSPEIWFSAISGVLSADSFVAGGLALCGAFAGGALCGISVAVALLGGLFVKEKLEREGAYG